MPSRTTSWFSQSLLYVGLFGILLFSNCECAAPIRPQDRFNNGLVCTGVSGDNQCKGLFCWRFKKDPPSGDGVCSTVCTKEGETCEHGGICRKGFQSDTPDRGYCVVPCTSEKDCAPTLGCQQINNQGEKYCWRTDPTTKQNTNGSKCTDARDCLGGHCIKGLFEGGLALCSETCTKLGDPCKHRGVCAIQDTLDGTATLFCLIECQQNSDCSDNLSCNASPSKRKYCGLAP